MVSMMSLCGDSSEFVVPLEQICMVSTLTLNAKVSDMTFKCQLEQICNVITKWVTYIMAPFERQD